MGDDLLYEEEEVATATAVEGLSLATTEAVLTGKER
jgi:hypothetical protein